jgi:hypothetical protein
LKIIHQWTITNCQLTYVVKPLTLFKSAGKDGVVFEPLTWFVVDEDDDESVRASVIFNSNCQLWINNEWPIMFASSVLFSFSCNIRGVCLSKSINKSTDGASQHQKFRLIDKDSV